jgi:hypothetical protein
VGRHALEKITSAPNGQLRQVRNLPVNVRVKAGLTRIRTTRIGDTKVGPNEPIDLLNGGD